MFFSTGNSEAVLHYDVMLCFLYRFKVSETEMVLDFALYVVFWSGVGIRLLGAERRDLQSDLNSPCLFRLL